MRLTRIAAIAILGIVLVSTVACSSESSSVPTSPCMTHEEAIALAQDEFDQSLEQIPCAEGRNQARAFCLDSGWVTWEQEPYNDPGEGAAGGWTILNDETEYIVVRNVIVSNEIVLWWRVYCDTKTVVPILDTHTQIQALITEYTTYCY